MNVFDVCCVVIWCDFLWSEICACVLVYRCVKINLFQHLQLTLQVDRVSCSITATGCYDDCILIAIIIIKWIQLLITNEIDTHYVRVTSVKVLLIWMYTWFWSNELNLLIKQVTVQWFGQQGFCCIKIPYSHSIPNIQEELTANFCVNS